MADADSNLWAAERVASLLVANGMVAVVIGGQWHWQPIATCATPKI